MSRGTLQADVRVISDAKQYDELIQASQDKVVIVDLHMDWCGPCSALTATYNKVVMDYEDAKDRVVFASCNYEKIEDKIQSTLPADTPVQLKKHGSLPLLAVYRFGANIGLLPGVDGPALLAIIDINIPTLKEAFD